MNPRKKKFDPRSADIAFSRYALKSNVNPFLMANFEISETSNNTIIEVRDVVYFENMFPFKSRVHSNPSCNLSTSDILSSSCAPPTDTKPRRSKRTNTHKNFREDFFTYFVECDILTLLRKQLTPLILFTRKKSLDLNQ